MKKVIDFCNYRSHKHLGVPFTITRTEDGKYEYAFSYENVGIALPGMIRGIRDTYQAAVSKCCDRIFLYKSSGKNNGTNS